MLIGVTGASGFIGRQLVPDLLAAGHSVKVLARSPGRIPDSDWKNSVEIITGDLQDTDSLVRFCSGCDLVIHLAALAHVTSTRQEAHIQSSVTGTCNLLDSMQRQQVKQLIFISSIKASASPNASAYATAKAKAEVLVRMAGEKGLASLILRPAIVYGAGMHGNLMAWMKGIAAGRVPGLPETSIRLQLVSRSDLCRAVMLAIPQVSSQATVHVVSDGPGYLISELQASLYKALGKKLPAIAMPRPLWWLAAKTAELLYFLTGHSPGFSGHSYRTLFHQDPFCPNTLQGFSPEDDFDSVLPAIVAGMENT